MTNHDTPALMPGALVLQILDRHGATRTLAPYVHTHDRDLLDTVTGDFRRWLTTPQQWESWQHAWNTFTRSAAHRPGLVHVNLPVCLDCRGRRIDMRRGRVCRSCAGTGRGRAQAVRTFYAPPPAASTR